MSSAKTPKAGPLEAYRDKRAAASTPEPMGSGPVSGRGGGVFVVHEHIATRHHWDLRLEIDGVLVSWAVTNKPSMTPNDKRLAIKVENHPLEYIGFEAVIPPGNYGAGPMIVWDRGSFAPVGDPAEAIRAGELKFELAGYKLRGGFTLVHTGGKRGRAGRGESEWLLIKKRDPWSEAFAAEGKPLAETSVLSGLTAEELLHGARRIAALRAEIAALGQPRRELAKGWKPMLCETAERAFSRPGWVFELKYDGYRLAGLGGAGQATLLYRSGLDATARYPEIAAAIRAMPCGGLLLDGEVVVLDGEGRPVFQRLQERAQLTRASEIERASARLPASYFVFDALAIDGFDLRALPLLRRKELLARLLPSAGPLRYADHVPELGVELLEQIVARGLEGVVAKKADSPYRSGIRSSDWLKMKRDLEADLAICGYTRPKGSRTGLGALHLCARGDGEWIYVGKVGTGFSDKDLVELQQELAALPAWKPTFPLPAKGSSWVEPSLVCQVRYREWPEDHLLRHPVFVRMRRDKPALEVMMPARRSGGHADSPAESPTIERDPQRRELRLSNLTKVFWPDDGYTKGDLIAYYRAIARWILPYLADRPVVMTRYPDGIDGKWFYQKDAPDWVPAWLRTIALWSESSQRDIHYLLVDDADGLAFLANLGSIPIHVWASRQSDLGRPDWAIIDLDPKGAPRNHVVELALAVHQLCDSLALPSYIKTSGQTGLHILVPLGGLCTYEQARTLAYLLALVIERQHGDIATTERNPAKRGGKVYLDWGQNAHGQLLVAPFSVRPVPGAQVSMPMSWDEVDGGWDPAAFTIKTAVARMEARGKDPMLPVLGERPDLAGALTRLGHMVPTS